MPLPFILAGAALLAGGYGIKKGLDAKEDFNKAIPYADKALSSLEGNGFKREDKSRYKSILNLMQKIYESLNQDDKVKVYQDKYDGANAKFVN